MSRHTKLLVAVLGVYLLSGGCGSLTIDNHVRVEDYTQTIRLACIGDSITFGAGIDDRLTCNYPAQLSRMLGDKWDVRNFGVSGATMLRVSDKPYWSESAFGNAIAFNPNIIVIMLGTNDSKSHWDAAAFERDYSEMIDTFKTLQAKPKIWVCLPVPAYAERWEIRNSVIVSQVIVIIRKVAAQKGVNVIDLYTALGGREDLFPDKIHPNAEGAGLIAAKIRQSLIGR